MHKKIYFGDFPATFDEISTFLLVLKHESFAIVSDIQELTRVKVMRRVNKFEDIFNARFFDRSYRSLKRTRSAIHIFKMLCYYEYQVSQIYQKVGIVNDKKYDFSILLPNFFVKKIISELANILKCHSDCSVRIISHYSQAQHNLMEYDIILSNDRFHPETSNWFKIDKHISFPQGIFKNPILEKDNVINDRIIKTKKYIHDLRIFNTTEALEACNNFYYDNKIPKMAVDSNPTKKLECIQDSDDYHATLYTVDTYNDQPQIIVDILKLINKVLSEPTQ